MAIQILDILLLRADAIIGSLIGFLGLTAFVVIFDKISRYYDVTNMPIGKTIINILIFSALAASSAFIGYLLSNTSYTENSLTILAYVFIIIGTLYAGIMYYVLFHKNDNNKRSVFTFSFLHTILMSIIVASVFAFLLYAFFGNANKTYLAISVFAFPIPYLFILISVALTSRPSKKYDSWQYPNLEKEKDEYEKRSEEDKEKMRKYRAELKKNPRTVCELGKKIEFYLKLESKFDMQTVKTPLVESGSREQIIFRYFIYKWIKNYQKKYEDIQLEDSDDRPYEWEFYIKRYRGIIKKRIDVNKSMYSNGITDNDIVIARRINV